MKTLFVNSFNNVIGTSVLLLEGVIIFFGLLYATRKNLRPYFKAYAKTYGLYFIAFISLACIIATLVYSENIGYMPTTVSWYSRIAMYPQALLAIIALVKKDDRVWKYILWLSVIGLLVSSAHTIETTTGLAILPCSQAISCAKEYMKEYGFISIPVMALSAFLANFLVSLLAIARSSEE